VALVYTTPNIFNPQSFRLTIFTTPTTMEQPARTLPTAIEAHRLRLEESLAKLRKALDNWRIYSFEYEALREELQALPVGASHEAMVSSHCTRYALFHAVRQGSGH